MTALTIVPPPTDGELGVLDRSDLVHAAGVLHLCNDGLTPHEAQIEDTLLLASILEDAGIAVTLVRHGRATPAVAIDASDAARASVAIASAGAGEPLYVKPKGGTPRLAVDAPPLAARPAAMKVYRPRITADGSLRYGAPWAARLEVWRVRDGVIRAPHDNVLMRRRTATADVEYTEVVRYGRSWRTIAGMFDPLPHEFTEDVDLVFSWVDGSSSEFQRQRAARMEEYVVGDGDDGPARFRHVDELRYALRSVHMHAPWVRRIFIATDSPAPQWLIRHPKVTIVRSEEFFADTSTLPTHNSHAVEAQLHHIPGLAEHFLYSNDDMFFGRAVEPEMFFTPGGLTKFVECDVRIGVGDAATHRSGHDNALRRNRNLLRERFGRTIVRDLEHCATPLRRSIMTELEGEFAEDVARTAASRFRSATDVSVTNCLYHYYAAFTGRAVATTKPRVRYVQTTAAVGLRRMERLAERPDVDMFCLNDGGNAEVPEEVRVRALRAALERMFPMPAPWERESLSAEERSARSAHPSARG